MVKPNTVMPPPSQSRLRNQPPVYA